MNPVVRAAIARTVARYLTDTCLIEQEVITSDAYGGQVSTWQSLRSVACRVLTETNDVSSDKAVASRESQQVSARVALPKDVPVAKNQRITVLGTTYEITDVKPLVRDSFGQIVEVKRLT
jgi:SPP1 family predicted phage head-tail adaptor